MVKNWVKTANGTTITRAFKVTVEADADVDDLIKAIRTEAMALGFPIVVDHVVNCAGNNEKPDKLVNLLQPQGSSKDNPILFTEMIDVPTVQGADKKYYFVSVFLSRHFGYHALTPSYCYIWYIVNCS